MNTIHHVGMSPNNSEYYGDFLLSDGRTGNAVGEPSGLCIEIGGLAARYSDEELTQIGSGDVNTGEIAVITNIASNPEGFQYGCTKPEAQLPASEIVLAGEVVETPQLAIAAN
jgi:hypothetical protein